LLLAFFGLALAEIGNQPKLFFSMLNLKPASQPVDFASGKLAIETLGGYLYKVRYVGPEDDVEAQGRVIAAALGAPKLKDAYVKWFRSNKAAIKGEKPPVKVKLGEAHVLTLELKDGKVLLEVAPFEVPENAFGKPRHVLGEKGPLIREYSDFYCPYCQRLALTVLPKIKAELVEKGVARFEYRHFPLVEIHPDAIEAARASECAAEQGKFLPFHDRLFADLANKKGANYLKIAKALGLVEKRFSDCLASDKYRDVVQNMRDEAERLGLPGTPSVFVGPFKLPNPFDVELYARYAAMAAAKK
jgi:predicted DsbA family dithiol-disulfide isomerase